MSVIATFLKRIEPVYQPLAIALTVILLGSLTFSLWDFARGQVAAEAHVRFDARASQITEAIRGRMLDYEQVLRGCAGLFATSAAVQRNEWHAYVEALRVNESYPGIQGIGFAQHVLDSAKAKHVTSIRAQGFPDYVIRPEGERAEYTPVVYIEPTSDHNLRALGFDMFSEPARRAAMEQARDTADIAISSKVTLAQETERDVQAGILMYLPVYANNADISRPDRRRAKLAGYVYSPFRVDDLMRGILGELRDVRVQIYDVMNNNDLSLLYDSHKSFPASSEPGYTAPGSIAIHGHTWILRMSSLPIFEAAIDYSKPRIVLMSGLAISLLLLAIIWSLSTLRARAVTLARRMTDELRESREQLSLALEGSELALFDWNVSTGEIELSARWAAMLGGAPRPTATTITDLSQLVHPDDLPRLQQMLRAALRGESAFYEAEHRVKDRRGEWIWILSRGKVTARDDSGLALRVTGTNANITQRKQVERMKEEFIGTVNHELRTPLTVIVGSLALLKEGLAGLSPDQAMMLDMACQNSERLHSLVNDILDFEKIVSGAMQFKMEAVALSPFLHRSLELNRMYADRFKVRYELHGPLLEVSVRADPERLMQVMTNLLSNAAKFSPEGDAIIIAATFDGNLASVTVTDHGPGVPTEFRGRIFEKFAQADGSNTRRQGGSGLGLSISKAIIENMGGRIGFDSAPGKGATFYFELPYTEDSGAG